MKVKPKPRLKCNQRKKLFLNDQHFQQVIQELTPLLMRQAHKIKRPHFIEDRDLVQEALLHIFRNRDKYKQELSTIKTWCLTVASRKFYNIATTEFRDIRCPKNADRTVSSIVEYDENENCACQRNDVEEQIHAKELISQITAHLKNDVAKKVFAALLDPPEKLIDMVRKDYDTKSAEKDVGERNKTPSTFSIKNYHLAKYFDVGYADIVKAKDHINEIYQNAIHGQFPRPSQMNAYIEA